MSSAGRDIEVRRGAPSDEELAALVAVLCARPSGSVPLTGYDAWRAQRLAALRQQRAH